MPSPLEPDNASASPPLTVERLDDLERQARSRRPMEHLAKDEVLALVSAARRSMVGDTAPAGVADA